ncbi:hypothetical protein GWK47_013177 [Chionoecetes opilio]|uniref:Nephrin n=1 Tax=Chionoecetes opilio TaxID=41210 RepID=A0A8J4Y0U9_CHIOP|nr:hypothetical protein GWK47_013177 [Chionoecetes opilio]
MVWGDGSLNAATLLDTPRLSLAAGNSVNLDDIKEGDDVYFECGIKANPGIYKVQWFHNTHVFGAAKNEQLNITCSVESHPEPTAFRWAFNSSSEVVDIPATRVRSVGKGRSQVSYVPARHQDYGSLLCWGTNDVGVQRQPCIYHVIHASPPDPVNNCTVENISSSGVGVRCQAGWDGGLAQTFTLSVTHARAHTSHSQNSRKAAPRVLANTSTAPRPEFALMGLEPGTEYLLTIMGVNNKGQSEPVRIAVVTLKDVAEKRTSPVGSALALSSLLGVVLGVLASLLVMTAVVVALVRRARSQRKPEVKMVYHKGAAGHHLPDDVDDTNPDVIPVNDDHQVQQNTQLTQQQQRVHQTTADVGASPDRQPPPHLDLYDGGHVQPQPSKEYLQGHEGSFYINPGTLLRQKHFHKRKYVRKFPLLNTIPVRLRAPSRERCLPTSDSPSFDQMDFLMATAIHPLFKLPVVRLLNHEKALRSPGPTATEGTNSTRLSNKMGKELESWCSEKQRNKLLEQAMFLALSRAAWIDVFVKYNTAIPSSAAVDKLFSQGSDVMKTKRASLTSNFFERLVFRKRNMDLLKMELSPKDSE